MPWHFNNAKFNWSIMVGGLALCALCLAASYATRSWVASQNSAMIARLQDRDATIARQNYSSILDRAEMHRQVDALRSRLDKIEANVGLKP